MRQAPALFLLLLTAPLGAQSVRGTVTDRAGVPLSGVVVMLLDSTDAALGRTLSDDAGAYRLSAPRSGTVSVRALRIGFQPLRTEKFVLTAEVTPYMTLVMDGARVTLATVKVVGKSSCKATAADGAVFEVWEQALSSLSASAITGATRGLTTSILRVDRVADPRGRILDQQLGMRTDNVLLPWRALHPDTLRKHGYVSLGRDDGLTYNAPGVDALVAPTFLIDHCVKLAQSKDTSEIGLAFEPAPERFRVAEISGTLWLSRETAALRRVEFTFGTVPGMQPLPVPAGGTMRFARLPNGGVVIEQWEIRMPVFARDGGSAAKARLEQVQSTGGMLVAVRRGSDTVYKRPPVRVVGQVRDSSSNAVSIGARVRLAGTRYETSTDADGRFTLDDVLPGEYTLAVQTPSLDSIRAEKGLSVIVRDSLPPIAVRVPTARQLAQTLCGPAFANAGRDRGAVMGTVNAGGDSATVAHIAVVADWIERSTNSAQSLLQGQGKRLETKTDATGGYRLCGVPTEQAVTVRAFPKSGRSEPTSVRLAPDQRFATIALTVDRARAALAVFTGRVVADSNRGPVEGAEVSVAGAPSTARTNAQGEFRIDDVPAGAQEVNVRRVGFAAYTGTVTFSANDEEQRNVVLRPLTLLDSVVTIAPPLDIRMGEFLEHKKLGLGFFLDRTELAKNDHRLLKDVMVGAAGYFQVYQMYVLSNRYMNVTRQQRECGPQAGMLPPGYLRVFYKPDDSEKSYGVTCSCYSKVYMNGVLLNRGTPTPPFDARQIPVATLEAVEWYNSPADTPGQYSGIDSPCGVLVLHTRRFSPRSP